MIQMKANYITVVEVIRDMGLEPETKLDWWVGDKMQEYYVSLCGEAPQKENRKKTSGGGNHCMALYPELFRLKIEGFVRMRKTEAARQPGLFSSIRVGGNGVEVEMHL